MDTFETIVVDLDVHFRNWFEWTDPESAAGVREPNQQRAQSHEDKALSVIQKKFASLPSNEEKKYRTGYWSNISYKVKFSRIALL